MRLGRKTVESKFYFYSQLFELKKVWRHLEECFLDNAVITSYTGAFRDHDSNVFIAGFTIGYNFLGACTKSVHLRLTEEFIVSLYDMFLTDFEKILLRK